MRFDLCVVVFLGSIDGEYVPKAGDEVAYRMCPVPPKMEKLQAVHVHIVNFCPKRHQKWSSPPEEDEDNDDVPPQSSLTTMAD